MSLLKNNDDCSLPCFWGITPGQSKMIDVKAFFAYLGWTLDDFSSTEGVTYWTGREINKSIQIDLAFLEVDGIVESIFLSLGGEGLQSFSTLYSLESVLSKSGFPTKVELALGSGGEIEVSENTNYALWVFYKNDGIVIKSFGIASRKTDKFEMCFDESADDYNRSVQLILYNPSTLSETQAYRAFGGEIDTSFAFQDVSPIDVAEFLSLVTSQESEKCVLIDVN